MLSVFLKLKPPTKHPQLMSTLIMAPILENAPTLLRHMGVMITVGRPLLVARAWIVSATTSVVMVKDVTTLPCTGDATAESKYEVKMLQQPFRYVSTKLHWSGSEETNFSHPSQTPGPSTFFTMLACVHDCLSTASRT
jgi:hypothetical protein